MCRRIVDDAAAAGLALPSPYDNRGADRLIADLADLADPDQVSDEVLNWLIDMPEAGVDGPKGLRFHAATNPSGEPSATRTQQAVSSNGPGTVWGGALEVNPLDGGPARHGRC